MSVVESHHNSAFDGDSPPVVHLTLRPRQPSAPCALGAMVSVLDAGNSKPALSMLGADILGTGLNARRYGIKFDGQDEQEQAKEAGRPKSRRGKRGVAATALRPERQRFPTSSHPVAPVTQTTIHASPGLAHQPLATDVPTQTLHGIAGLTQDAYGRIYWRGTVVDCLWPMPERQERRTAFLLAQRCKTLENKGFAVTARALYDKRLFDAPARTKWQTLLYTVYAVMHDQEVPKWIVLAQSHRAATALCRSPREGLQYRVYVSENHHSAASVACKSLTSAGLALSGSRGSSFAMDHEDLMQAVGLLGITPQDVAFALSAAESSAPNNVAA